MRNGLLPMLKRNIAIKTAPQRWQENADDGPFDVVFTFEERVFDVVLEDLDSREQRLLKSVLIINMDVKDNHEEASLGAKLALELCQRLEAVNDWEDSIDDIITAFEKQYKRKNVYSISYY
jgi:RNA polymerase II subunit A C-terminal domain phosphatase SSU72